MRFFVTKIEGLESRERKHSSRSKQFQALKRSDPLRHQGLSSSPEGQRSWATQAGPQTWKESFGSWSFEERSWVERQERGAW